MRAPQALQPAHGSYERADVVSDQSHCRVENTYLMGWITFHAAEFLETCVDYPPSQEPASFTIDQLDADVNRRIQEKAAKGAK